MTGEDESTRSVDEASADWSVREGTLFRSGDVPGERSRFGSAASVTALREALDHAVATVRERPAEHDGYAVPLHEPGAARLTEEYVLWRPDAEQFGWYDEAFGIDGTVRFVDVATATETDVGDRLHRWHPDERGDSDGATDRDDEPGDVDAPPATVEPASSLSSRDAVDVVAAVRERVARERDRERAGHRDRRDEVGIETLVADGVATGPFVAMGRTNRPDDIGEFELQLVGRERDVTPRDGPRGTMDDVYPGSVFLVHALEGADPTAMEPGTFPFAVRATAVDGPTVTLTAAVGCDLRQAAVEAALSDRDREFWLTPLLNPVPYERRLDALDAVAAHPGKRALFAGTRPARFAADELSSPSVPVELNPYQRRALKWAVDAEDVVCIHGPPGTGKTRTLTAFVLHAASHGQSVLVTAHSNQAVDNLLVGDSTPDSPEPDTLHAYASGHHEGYDADVLSIARVGRNSTNDVVAGEYATRSVASADVVAATTSGAATFDEDEFDVAVVDEATQASRAATAIPLHVAETLVLSGDHRQLPPYATGAPCDGHDGTTDQSDDARPSLFEQLLQRYGDDVAVLLGRQYRMHESIAAFPNAAFYGGELETAAAVRDRSVDGLEPLVAVDVGDGRGERQADGAHSYANPDEADVVVDEVRRLLDVGVAPSDVGVIATYRAQVDLLRQRLGESELTAGPVAVDTVDAFQGGEREAVVVSFVRSNPAGASGFLESPGVGPRRLNVALTRARRRLALVGDFETLATVGPGRAPVESCAEVYAALRARLASEDRFR